MTFEDINSFGEALEKMLNEVLDFDIRNPFNDVKKVLCIEPHPDDCVIGIGGTIKKLVESGIEVVYVCMTDGSMGTLEFIDPHELALIRKKEEEQSASILGVKKILWLNYSDTQLPYTAEVRNTLVRIIRAEKPDIVLAPDPWLPYESHPDHRITGFLAIESVSFAGLPNFSKSDIIVGLEAYQVSGVGFYYTHRPNYFVDITDVMDLKLKAIRTHKSQFTDNIWEQWEPFLRTTALYYGEKAGVKYAEGLRFVPGIFLHIAPFSELI